MPKSRGTIVFDEEMREPGESVWHHNGGQDQPPVSVQNRRDDKSPTGQGADGMKNPSGGLAVGENVIGPEI